MERSQRTQMEILRNMYAGKASNNTCQLTFWSALLFVYGFAMLHKTTRQPKCSCTLRYEAKGCLRDLRRL